MWGYQEGLGMAMGIAMMLFWVAIIVLAVWAVIRFSAGSHGGPGGNEARRILDERYARGEIDEDEFRKRASVLRGG